MDNSLTYRASLSVSVSIPGSAGSYGKTYEGEFLHDPNATSEAVQIAVQEALAELPEGFTYPIRITVEPHFGHRDKLKRERITIPFGHPKW